MSQWVQQAVCWVPTWLWFCTHSWNLHCRTARSVDGVLRQQTYGLRELLRCRLLGIILEAAMVLSHDEQVLGAQVQQQFGGTAVLADENAALALRSGHRCLKTATVPRCDSTIKQ